VIVLVGLGMDDDRMRQTGGLDELYVIFQGIGGRLVGRIRRVGDAFGIEKVNVSFDRQRCRCGEQGRGRR